MCGIFGVWNFKGVRGKHLLAASKLLAHRGPDGEGIMAGDTRVMTHRTGVDFPSPGNAVIQPDERLECALVHRRLSVVDLSENARQPMTLPGRDVHIVFNGEIYNHRELADTFSLDLCTSSDTEVILAMYNRFGLEMFPYFRGMWAMAILDREAQRLVLSRDRFGIKPLYYTRRGEGLAFAGELKPLLQLPGITHEWEKDRFLEYVTFGATRNPDETFAKDVHALPAGDFAVYDLTNGALRTQSYYRLPRFGDRKPDGDFTAIFRQAVDEHLLADVEVGSCLSGGLDSGLIVATAARNPRVHRPFQTFTCTFPGRAFDEGPQAKALGNAVDRLQPHFTTPTSEDLLRDMDSLVRVQERPIGSASIYAQYSVMKLVSERGVKVVLDGQGADEVFGGYYPFAGAFLLTALRKGQFGLAAREYTALKSVFNPKMGNAVLRAGYYALPNFAQSFVRRAERVGFDLLSISARREAKTLTAPQRGSADFNALTRRSIQFGLKELLHYEDRNSMHFGVESRVPFLDHRLVEWAVLSPPESKIRNGWTKWPLRQELAALGVEDVAWRRDKLGFVAPQAEWKKQLAPVLLSDVLDGAGAEFFDRSELTALFGHHQEGSAGQTAFWRIFFLLKWLDAFKVEIV